MTPSKKKKSPKRGSSSKKVKVPSKLGYIPAVAGIAGLTGIAGLGIKGLINANKKSIDYITMEPVNEEKKIDFYTELESKALQKSLVKEQEANKKLVDHINKCNKEVIRLQGLVAKKESLHKEAVLRSTIKKLQQKNQKVIFK